MDLPKKSGGLGSGNPPRSSSLLSIPCFRPKSLPEDIGASWRNLNREITSDLASLWFNLEISPGLAAVMNNFEEPGSDAPSLRLPLSSITKSWSDFGEPQTLKDSRLAKRLLAYLDSKISVAFRHSLAQIGKSAFINLDDPGGDAPLLSDSDDSLTWSGPWGTSLDSRVIVNLQVLKNAEGQETAVWFIDGLVGTRAEQLGSSGELSDRSTHFRSTVLPSLARNLLYLSETQFPSSLFTNSRKLSYGDLEEKYWPKPFYAIEDFRLVGSPLLDESGNAILNFHIFPQAVVFGWYFSEMNDESIDLQVSNSVDSLVRLSTILEDGFRNHQSDEIPGEWPSYFGKVSSIEPGWKRAQTASWVPNTQVGFLVAKTTEAYFDARKSSSSEILREISEYGAGSQVSDAINTLVFSELIEKAQYEEAIGYLRAAIDLEHQNQSTNAISNLGQVYLAMGNEMEAESSLLLALDRFDKFAEGEASVLLAELYLRRGEVAKAEAFFRRAEQSGEERYVAQARAFLNSNAETRSTRRENTPGPSEDLPPINFCTNCGASFANSEQSYCGNCGVKRLS